MTAALLFVALALLVPAAYWPSRYGELIFDDGPLIYRSAFIQHGTGGTGPWRRILLCSYRLNYWWSGTNTGSYHAVNLVIHVINSMLVYGILVALNLGGTAEVGALTFALHPMAVPAVASISGRSSSLSGLFYLAAILAGLTDHPALMALMALMAVDSKQDAIVLPVVLSIVLQSWMLFVLLFGLFAVCAVWYRRELASLGRCLWDTARAERVLPWRQYVPLAFVEIPLRLLSAALLFEINNYPDIQPRRLWTSRSAVSLMVTAGLLGEMAWGGPLARATVLFYMLPVGLYMVIPTADVYLPHRAYLSTLGMAVISSHVFGLSPMVVLYFCVLCLLTLHANESWRTAVAFWRHVADTNPQSCMAWFNLGASHHLRDSTVAEACYRRALSIDPSHPGVISNLAAIYIERGDYEGETLLRGLIETGTKCANVWTQWAGLLSFRGRSDDAIAAYARASQLDPCDPWPHVGRAQLYAARKRYDSAVAHMVEALYHAPHMTEWYMRLGKYYIETGESDRAAEQFQIYSKRRGFKPRLVWSRS